MEKYKNIIFDFNGTLLDDCDVCLRILNLITKEYGLGTVSKEKYMEIFTFPVSNYYKSLGFDVSEASFEVIGGKFHYYYDLYSPTEAVIFQSALSLLPKLKEEGYHLVCLSASKHETLVNQLKYYGIYDYFDEVLGLSDKLARSKLQLALNWMNNSNLNPNECLFIGDSEHDMEVADAMNVKSLIVATGHTARHRLVESGCEVINNLDDVISYL